MVETRAENLDEFVDGYEPSMKPPSGDGGNLAMIGEYQAVVLPPQ